MYKRMEIRDVIIERLLEDSKRKTFPLIGTKVDHTWYIQNQNKAISKLPITFNKNDKVLVIRNFIKNRFKINLKVVSPIVVPNRFNISTLSTLSEVIDKVRKSKGNYHGRRR